MKRIIKERNGITLIALVVTIIVLLILAGISIMMLTGQNGILNRSAEAKEKTGVAQVDESVKLAISDALTNGLGTITEENLVKALNSYLGEDKYTLSGDATNGWDITAKENGKVYHVDGNGTMSGGTTGGGTTDSNYSVAVSDEDIAPADLFLYEVIDENAKTARITGMNPKYCNGKVADASKSTNKKYAKLNTIMPDIDIKKNDNIIKLALDSGSSSDSEIYQDTNYEVIYNGEKISDTVIVPYKWENNGNEYTIKEACISATSSNGKGTPLVKTIIFPNTVERIYGQRIGTDQTYSENKVTTNIVLPKNLKSIEERAFEGMQKLAKVDLPSSVQEIGDWAFGGCLALENINLENITKLGDDAFSSCYGLKNVDISNVEEIGYFCFSYCTHIENITVTEKTTSMGDYVFNGWMESQTINVYFKDGKKPSGWNDCWNSNYSSWR